MASWASGSDEADAHIVEQAKAGGFPMWPKPGNWDERAVTRCRTSSPGVASDETGAAELRPGGGSGDPRLHPVMAGLEEEEILKGMFGQAEAKS